MTPSCPYCGEAAQFVEAAAVGLDGGGDNVWWCEKDKAWAMIHANSPTNKPVTRLSKKHLHDARGKAISAFTRLYKTWGVTRRHAYDWLANEMSIAIEDCDFGKFDLPHCLAAYDIAQSYTPFGGNDA